MSNEDLVKKVRNSIIAMRPVLPITQPLDLGSVGTIDDDGVFHYLGTIGSMLGLNSLGGELTPVINKDLAWSLSTGKNVKVGIGAKADTTGEFSKFANARGNATISFESANSSFLAVKGLTTRELAEPQLLINAMLSAYKADQFRWKEDWVFIYQLGIAHRRTIILSSQANTKVLLKGSGKLAAGAAANVDLAAGFQFEISTNSVEQLVGTKNDVAFYNAYRVKDSWFSSPHAQNALRMSFGTEVAMYPKVQLSPTKVFSKV